MMNNISLAGNALKYMREHIFQSLALHQSNTIKKIAVIASIVIGVAAGIYVLYKVSSCLFSKTGLSHEEDFDPKDLNIDLEEIKRGNSFAKTPSAHTSDLEEDIESKVFIDLDELKRESFLAKTFTFHKLDSDDQEKVNVKDLKINLNEREKEFSPGKPSPKIVSKAESPKPTQLTPPITESFIQDDEEDFLPTPVSSPPKSPKIDSSSQPSVDSALIPVIQPKSQKQIDLELEFGLLCDEAKKEKFTKSVMHLIVLKLNDKPYKAIELINFACSQGIAIDIGDETEKTPLYYAKNVDLLHHLIDCGANPNAQDLDGRTPLHCANTLEMVQAFFNRGAKVDSIDKKGITILEAQIDKYIDYPSNIQRKVIVEFLLANDAKLGLTDYTGELLKKAFQEAIKPKHTQFPFNPQARNTCLTIAKKLIELGADLKTSDPDGKLLETSLRQAIMAHDDMVASKTLLFKVADELIQFVPNLAICDPQGQLLIMAFEKIINDDLTLWDTRWVQYYLDVVDKLSKMGSVRLDVADPTGKLLYKIINDASAQDPDNKPCFFDPYFKVIDKLMEMGASFAVSDPSGMFLEEMIEFSVCHRKGDLYFALAKKLLKKGRSLHSEQISRLNRNIIGFLYLNSDWKPIVIKMIEAGYPEEIVIQNKTLAEWKKEI